MVAKECQRNVKGKSKESQRKVKGKGKGSLPLLIQINKQFATKRAIRYITRVFYSYALFIIN